MTVITYPTSIDLNGPWLLKRDDLLELEKIIDDAWEEFKKFRDSIINQKVSERIAQNESNRAKYIQADTKKENIDYWQKEYPIDPKILRLEFESSYPFSNYQRILIIKGTDGAKIDVPEGKFINILDDLNHQHTLANGFSLHLKCIDIDAKINLAFRSYNQKLDIDIMPENISETKRLFNRIRVWAEERRPSKLKTWWQDGVLASIWLIFSLFMLLLLMNIYTIGEGTPSAQARELLRHGISKSNELKAIELLLKIEAHYDEGVVKLLPNFWFFLGGMATIFLVLLIRPNNILGIGKGHTRIKIWESYFKVLKYTIPSSVSIAIIYPYIYDLVKSYLPFIN